MFGTCPLATGSRVGSATDPAGRGACTVTADVPLLPSLVAVTVAVPPSATSVTSPVGDTVITVGVLDVHATGRPVKGLPLASLSVTFSWMVPWSGSVAGAGLTTTVATGTSATVTAAVPAFPSLVAVIVAVPAATPFTSPLLLTVAILVLLLAHVTVRPVSAVPAESFGVAVSCAVCPTVRLAVAGATATEATGIGVTVIPAVLLLPSLVAVMLAEPGAMPVTRPLGLTVATVVSPLLHVTVRPAKVPPAESFGVAVSCTVCATRIEAVAGATATEATGTGVTVTAALPALPSLVAVIVAVPTAPLVTSPLLLTVATPGLLLTHVTDRPVSAVPVESFGVAVSCSV